MIAIVDLGVGNFANVEKAISGLTTNDPNEISRADKLILPGVGNFGEAAKQLEPLRELLLDRIKSGTPFLGICLGMQLLFPVSTESKGEGLGVLSGSVEQLPARVAPHIGWNQVFPSENNSILRGISPGTYFYFVHSYVVRPEEENVIMGTTEYGIDGETGSFPSAVSRDNVFGLQFHPEKSSQSGLRILKNFEEL